MDCGPLSVIQGSSGGVGGGWEKDGGGGGGRRAEGGGVQGSHDIPVGGGRKGEVRNGQWLIAIVSPPCLVGKPTQAYPSFPPSTDHHRHHHDYRRYHHHHHHHHHTTAI